ncbi:MAG: Chromosome segregation and condensation protein [Chloroflexi bacterium]|nr:MAG: Chromosome segregation and condensation protein [Chloroflexota bacterium]
MDFQIASHQSDAYQINTEVYSGPLDLLLKLIERAELDITRLALAQVTDQYLEYLHHLEEQDASEVSAFLVIAARLVQIKSSALLPKSVIPGIQSEEDPGDALAQQLIIYKRFKELSGFLEKREVEGLRTYLRLDTSPRTQIASKLDLSELTLETLIQVAREIFLDSNNLPPLSDVVSFPRITIREKINTILHALQKEGALSFNSLLSNDRDRLEIVVTFLALLELVKRHMVGANQNALFGTIGLVPEGELSALEDQDLEFVE